MSERELTRREIIKKAAYITPIITTVQANFSFASAGSGDDDSRTSIGYIGKDKEDKNDKKDKKDKG